MDDDSTDDLDARRQVEAKIERENAIAERERAVAERERATAERERADSKWYGNPMLIGFGTAVSGTIALVLSVYPIFEKLHKKEVKAIKAEAVAVRERANVNEAKAAVLRDKAEAESAWNKLVQTQLTNQKADLDRKVENLVAQINAQKGCSSQKRSRKRVRDARKFAMDAARLIEQVCTARNIHDVAMVQAQSFRDTTSSSGNSASLRARIRIGCASLMPKKCAKVRVFGSVLVRRDGLPNDGAHHQSGVNRLVLRGRPCGAVNGEKTLLEWSDKSGNWSPPNPKGSTRTHHFGAREVQVALSEAGSSEISFEIVGFYSDGSADKGAPSPKISLSDDTVIVMR